MAQKTTVIDLLNEYLKKGLKPPPQLLQAAAQQEALKKPNIDPVNALAFAPSMGILGAAGNEMASPLIEPALKALNALSGGNVKLPQYQSEKVPQIVSKGAKKGLSGPATSDLTGGGTDELKPEKLFQSGKETEPLPGNLGIGGSKTEWGFGGAGSKTGPKSSADPFLVDQKLPEAFKTEKLTPFEAHSNIVPEWDTFKPDKGFTGTLPGATGDLGTIKARETNFLNSDNRTMSLEPEDIEHMTSLESPKTEDLVSLLAQNLGPKDTKPLPENMLYHGMKVWGTSGAKKTLPKIAQEGMRGGWFSEEPHQEFGPNFIAATPEDLPPMIIRNKQFSQDPEKELIPRWNNFPTQSLEARMKLKGHNPAETLVPDTIKGRPAKRSLWANIHQLMGADEGGGGQPFQGQGGAVVPPEKLFLTDRKGDVIGRMAPKGGGENAISKMFEKATAFKNVLEKGTTTIDNVFSQLFGQDPEHVGAGKGQKVAKLQQFLQSEPSKSSSMHEIWQKFATPVKKALGAEHASVDKFFKTWQIGNPLKSKKELPFKDKVGLIKKIVADAPKNAGDDWMLEDAKSILLSLGEDIPK